MENLNFITCGNTGDLIHASYVAKNLCKKNETKANIYIADASYNGIWGCGNFTFPLEKTFDDVKELMSKQDWIANFSILPRDFDKDYTCLQKWRGATPRTWSKILSEEYDFTIPEEYPWINVPDEDDNTKGKVLIHRSDKRHNETFPWARIISEIDKEILFITSNEKEYNEFRFRNDKVKPYFVETIYDMAKALKSCDLFIGNQSLLFAIANSLDTPRICELHDSSYFFYAGEHDFSENISWYLNGTVQHNSENIKIKL